MEMEDKTAPNTSNEIGKIKSHYVKSYVIRGRHITATVSNKFSLQDYAVALLHISQPQLNLKLTNIPAKQMFRISMIGPKLLCHPLVTVFDRNCVAHHMRVVAVGTILESCNW